MKTYVLAVLLFACSGFAAEEPKPELPFELKEVIIQVASQKPQFVTREPIVKQRVSLGENLTTWITVQLRPGAKSPCTSRDEERCHLELRVADKDADRSKLKYLDVKTRIDEKIETSTAYPIERDDPVGEQVFLFRLRYKDEILCNFEFPVEVTE